MNAGNDVIESLVANRGDFLRFLERRLDRATAEDVLQDSFVRSLGRANQIEPETAVAWFYQVLRNALIDRARRRGTLNAALERLKRDVGDEHAPAPDTRDAACPCIGRLARTLSPDQEAVLSAVAVEGQTVGQFAQARGIRPGTAAVRAFRARNSLKKQVLASCGQCAERGCIDCTCHENRPRAYQ
jgi:RNA polymerase sigma-70 factor (ECF subfamily)